MNTSRKSRFTWRMPDFQFAPPVSVKATYWHAQAGDDIAEGGRLLEVLAGDAAVTLNSPCSGTLVRWLVDEDAELNAGQDLAILESEDERGGPAR